MTRKPKPTAAEALRWRVGRKVGRTVYIGDTLVGVMDTPELAIRVVEAVNEARAPGKRTKGRGKR